MDCIHDVMACPAGAWCACRCFALKRDLLCGLCLTAFWTYAIFLPKFRPTSSWLHMVACFVPAVHLFHWMDQMVEPASLVSGPRNEPQLQWFKSLSSLFKQLEIGFPTELKPLFRRSKAKDSFSGHTLLDIDATVAKPGFKPPISMKAMQNEPWMPLEPGDS